MGGCEEGTALQHQALIKTNSYCPHVGVCKCPAALCDCICGCTQRRVLQPLIRRCPAFRNYLVGRSFRTDLCFLTPALSWGKNKNVYFTVARPEGVTPLGVIFILSSLERRKPCPRGCERSVFDAYLPAERAQSKPWGSEKCR